MSFGWTQPGNLESWRSEEFKGYFTDIQRAARKSFPRKPDKELRGLFGIRTVSGGVDGQACNGKPKSVGATGGPQSESSQEVVGSEKLITHIMSAVSCLWCRDQDPECTRRERSLLASVVYLAVVVILLLIVVIILATIVGTSAADNAGDAGDNRLYNGDKTIETTTHHITAPGIPGRPSTISQPLPGVNISNTAAHSSRHITVRKSHVTTVSSDPHETIRTSVGGTDVNSTSNARTSHRLPAITTSSSTRSPPANATDSIPSYRSLPHSTIAPTDSSTTSPDISTTPTPRHLLVTEAITCTTHDCISANETMSIVDTGVSPCTDFHEFACGGWPSMKQNQTRNSSAKAGTSLVDELRLNLLRQIQAMLDEEYDSDETVPQRVAKRLYQSCMHTNRDGDMARGLQEMHTLLDPLGIDEKAEISGKPDDVMQAAYMHFAVAPLFKASVVPAIEKGVKVYMLQIEPPTLMLHSTDYKQPLETNKVASRYVSAVTDILFAYITSFGTNNTDATSNYERINAKVYDVYRLEAHISAIVSNHTKAGTRVNVPSRKMSPGGLRRKYSNMDWDKVLGLANIAGRINVLLPAYFQDLNIILQQYDNNTKKMHAFMTILLQGVLPKMGYQFRVMLTNASYNDIVAHTEVDCVGQTLDHISDDVHSLYVARHTQTVLYNRIALDSLTSTLTTTLNRLISSAAWIHADLKTVIGVFLRNMKINFSPVRSYLPSAPDITVAGQSFLSLSVAVRRMSYAWQVTKVGSNVTDVILDWTSSQITYDSALNYIGLPTGLTVYMASDDPLFKLHGTVGVLVAKQLVEVLTGDLRSGEAPSWWGEQNIDSFRRVADCFRRQNTTLLGQPDQEDDIGNIIKINGAMQLVRQAYATVRPAGYRLIPGTSLPEHLLLLINAAQLTCHFEEATIIGPRISNVLGERKRLNERVNSVAPDQKAHHSLISDQDQQCSLYQRDTFMML